MRNLPHIIWRYKKTVLWSIFAVWFYFCLPDPLFNTPCSTVVYASNGEFLGAKIASDGQWRFPVPDSVPEKFKQCILYFEDEYFYSHPGINPVALGKAFISNINSGKIVRGGSTITMQVIRLALNNPKRTYWQKFKEIIYALRLELGTSKDNILKLYCAHAPFGGNVVGIEAASWRYFGCPPQNLSWGEAATLAVLPNAPALIYPGKNQHLLKEKRNRLLQKLLTNHIIDSLTYLSAIQEPLPGKPIPLPSEAYHLTQKITAEIPGKKITTSIDYQLQKNINTIIERYHKQLAVNNIHNIAVVVTETNSGKIKAYIGNTRVTGKDNGSAINMVETKRSTGSILKPLLYALAMKEHLILPQSLMPDIPTSIAGFHPKNFDKTYHGAVHADVALAQSLNIPAVRLLKDYGLHQFKEKLNRLYLKSIDKKADYYGLTLILGGAEITLREAVGLYASMGRVLNTFSQEQQYNPNDYFMPFYLPDSVPEKNVRLQSTDHIGAENIWFVFDALSKKDRPVEGGDWIIYNSNQKIAWKTGTSFGHRDAWCIGVTPEYTVGVWVGNTSNEGRKGLTGTQVAAPIMFDIFKLLPVSPWFSAPETEFATAGICTESGFIAGENCKEISNQFIPKNGLLTKPCPYHKLIHLDQSKQFQVNSSCYDVEKIISEKYFVLPPIMGYYFQKKHPWYKPLPPFKSNCNKNQDYSIGIIYPKNHAKIFIPKDFNNTYQKVVLKASHLIENTELFWYIDNEFIQKTLEQHEVERFIPPGKHTLVVTDKTGNFSEVRFEVIGR